MKILENTPVEEYKVGGRTVYVKREDMCVEPPGPPFSKCRGLYKHMEWLKGQGFTTVGYAESAISMAGIGVAYCAKELGMKAIIFDPQYKDETPELLEIHREKWKFFEAEVIPLKAGRTTINHYLGQKYLIETYGKNAIMLPIGLRLQESVDETAKEWERTMKVIRPDVTIVPVGSGTIFAGLIKGAVIGDGILVGIMLYKGNRHSKLRQIYKKAGKIPGTFHVPQVKVFLHDTKYEYNQKSEVDCPFPSHPFYDLKAWEWLGENISFTVGKILFWNIGKEAKNKIEK